MWEHTNTGGDIAVGSNGGGMCGSTGLDNTGVHITDDTAGSIATGGLGVHTVDDTVDSALVHTTDNTASSTGGLDNTGVRTADDTGNLGGIDTAGTSVYTCIRQSMLHSAKMI